MGAAHTITFQTSKFDVTKETPNPINPIYGQSVLQWLGDRLRDAYQVGTPDTEDWGWYVDVTTPEATYLVGASAESEQPGNSLEWTIQIHRHRTFKDNLTGANKLTPDDALTARIASLLRADPEIRDVEVGI